MKIQFSAYCRLVSMTAANHAKASMILVVMLDPSMTVRPVKLTLSLTGSHTFSDFPSLWGGHAPHNEEKSEKCVTICPAKCQLDIHTIMLGSSMTTKIMLALARLTILLSRNHAKQPSVC